MIEVIKSVKYGGNEPLRNEIFRMAITFELN